MGWVHPGKAPGNRDAFWPDFWGNELASSGEVSALLVPSGRSALSNGLEWLGFSNRGSAVPCGRRREESPGWSGGSGAVSSLLSCRGGRIEQVEGRQCHLLLCDKMGRIRRGKEEVMPYRLVEGKQCRVLSGPDLFSAASWHLASRPVVSCRVLS
jgi:hypothetical protein